MTGTLLSLGLRSTRALASDKCLFPFWMCSHPVRCLFASQTIRLISKVIIVSLFPVQGRERKLRGLKFYQVAPRAGRELQPHFSQSTSVLRSHSWLQCLAPLLLKLGWPCDYHPFWKRKGVLFIFILEDMNWDQGQTWACVTLSQERTRPAVALSLYHQL